MHKPWAKVSTAPRLENGAGTGQYAALVEEATRRTALLWIEVVDREPARAAWHVWREGSAYVVHGEGEQSLPGLDAAVASKGRVEVIVRSKDDGRRLARWPATCGFVEPGTPEWEAVVPELAGKRLNARDPKQQPARWANSCRVVRLTPKYA